MNEHNSKDNEYKDIFEGDEMGNLIIPETNDTDFNDDNLDEYTSDIETISTDLIEREDLKKFNNQREKIAIIGIGGAGNNAIERLYTNPNYPYSNNKKHDNIFHYVLNTDYETLGRNPCENKIKIGEHTTRGRGAGMKIAVGKKATEESKDTIREILKDKDLVIITAGLGGGTGTLGSSVVAEIAREVGAVVVAVVTSPSRHENRMKEAKIGAKQLLKFCHGITIISNQNAADLNPNIHPNEAMDIASDELYNSIFTLMEILTKHHKCNIDFNDIKSLYTNGISSDDTISNKEPGSIIKYIRKSLDYEWFRKKSEELHKQNPSLTKFDETYSEKNFEIYPELITEMVIEINKTPLTYNAKISETSGILAIVEQSKSINNYVFNKLMSTLTNLDNEEDIYNDDFSIEDDILLDDFDIYDEEDTSKEITKITPLLIESDQPVLNFNILVKLSKEETKVLEEKKRKRQEKIEAARKKREESRNNNISTQRVTPSISKADIRNHIDKNFEAKFNNFPPGFHKKPVVNPTPIEQPIDYDDADSIDE